MKADTSRSSTEDRVSGGEPGRGDRRPERFEHNPIHFLEPAEEIHSVCRAVRLSGLRARLDFGFLWPWYQSVLLYVTDRRMVEVVTPFGGRAPGHRIREFRWSGVLEAEVKGGQVRLMLGDGSRRRWGTNSKLEALSVREDLERKRPAMGGRIWDGKGPLEADICPACSAASVPIEGVCRACDTRFIAEGEAGWLAVLLPGGGHLATGHVVVGAGRFLTELAVFLGLWMVPGRLQRASMVFPMAVLMLVLLTVFKVEAVMTARAFARLIVPWSRRTRRAWVVASVVGAVVMAAWYLSALAAARQMNRGVLNDLEFHSGGALGWEAKYDEAIEDDIFDPIHRSTWIHEDRWTLNVSAQPLSPFDAPEDWIREEEEWRTEAGWSVAAPFQAGAVDGVRFTRIDGSGGNAIATVEYVVFDRLQRDLHVVSCEVLSNQVEEINSLILLLVRSAHWTKAGDPCFSSWDPE